MKIGKLNKRINIEAKSRVPDGMGGFVLTFTPVATSIAAAIVPIKAKEIIAAMSTTMTVTHQITIRYRSGIKPSQRISCAGSYFNIVSIINKDMDNRQLDILAKEVI